MAWSLGRVGDDDGRNERVRRLRTRPGQGLTSGIIILMHVVEKPPRTRLVPVGWRRQGDRHPCSRRRGVHYRIQDIALLRSRVLSSGGRHAAEIGVLPFLVRRE